MFNRIIALSNLQEAYLNLVEQMEGDGRSSRYAGWDSLKLVDLEINSSIIIEEIREELINFVPLSPAILVSIPKKNKPNKFREIYIYNLKDRIKAQAIYQIVEPYFDNYLSPWLFSYRVSHPSYFAARNAVRHYHRYLNHDYIVVADMADYSSHIKSDILLDKLRKMGFDEPMIKLLQLFIDNQEIRNGIISKPEEGLITGTPLIGLFNNLYLDDFDKYCGKTADFYRRVGDDLIIFDKDPEKLKMIYDHLLKEVIDLNLHIHAYKTKIISANEPFEYLGYYFNNGLISFTDGFLNSTLCRWRIKFNYYDGRTIANKNKFLVSAFNSRKNSLLLEFRELAKQKKLVNDVSQLKIFSENFFHILTVYFFQKYTPRNRRILSIKLKKLKLISFYKVFLSTIYDYPKSKKSTGFFTRFKKK